MCKVFLMSGIKPETVDKAWAFAQEIGKRMSVSNTDGLGYAAITKEGKLFGERWLKNRDAFGAEYEDLTPLDTELFNNLGDALESSMKEYSNAKGDYNTFGDVVPGEMVALTLHTRMATSAKGMHNTHPFVQDNVSLIHNGVIRNPELYGMKNSTCDSESILQGYLTEDVLTDPANISKIADKLEGYYACGVLANSSSGPVLDLFRNGARLYAAFIKELDTYVISTEDDDIKNTARYLGYTMGEVYKINEGKFIRINAITHKTISITKFSTVGPVYKGYQSNYTQTTSQTTPTGPTGKDGVTKDNVYSLGKHKNPKLQQELRPYYMAGNLTCARFDERAEQEMIMAYESKGG